MLEVLGVADALAKEGVSVEVIDLRTIAPLDMATINRSVARTGRAVIAHEAQVDFGVGAEIATRLHRDQFGRLKAPVGRVGAARSPVPFSKPLESAFIPTAARIRAAILDTLAPSVATP
jgi:pyruvate dehydrogenase E1 component beta subunit